MAEEIAPEVPAEQEPPKKKEKKKDGKMSTPVLIGVIVGVVILQIVIILVVVQVFFSDTPDEENGEATDTEMVDKPREPSEEELEEREFFTDDSKKLYMETGKIVTNPKLSSKYVAINVGLIYLPKESVEQEQLADGSAMMQKLQAEIKSRIIMTIGAMTPEELQESRGFLTDIIKEELKPIFFEKDIYLREVLISEYIMQ